MAALCTRSLLVAALIVALARPLCGGAASRAAQENAPPPQKTLVAVVDMGRVLAGCKEWQDAVAERARMLDTARRTLDKLARKGQVLRNEYENLPPGTEERRKKAEELEAALQEYQQTRQQLDEEAARQHEGSVRNLFAKLSGVVAEYAKEHGISVVLKKQDFDLSAPQSVEQSLQIATTEVLYADPALDISAAVIERLNAGYKGPIEVK
jgi:Skp family chaperone for outer membrane proteins